MRIIASLVVVLLLAWPATAGAIVEKTFYDHIEDAWAFGEVSVLDPMEYRDGALLAFPGRITELIHARYGRPQSILLVYELEDAGEALPFGKGTPFIAPIRVLQRTKYWRDNLPNTPRHEVIGGRRYVFKDEAAEAAKSLGAAYAATIGLGMPDRKLQQGEIVTGALASEVAVLSEDSVRFLAGRTLTHITDQAADAMAEFAAGKAPLEQRVAIIEAIGRAELDSVQPQLEKIAKREDAAGAAALAALSAIGDQRETKELIALSKSDSAEVAAWAYGELGARAGTDVDARKAAQAVIESDAAASIRSAACEGLGRSESDSVVESLRGAVYLGDESSRAAAMALAKIGSPSAIASLKAAVVDAPNEGMVGAVMAMVAISKPCGDCQAFLKEQHEKHDEEAIRELIGIVADLEEEQRKQKKQKK